MIVFALSLSVIAGFASVAGIFVDHRRNRDLERRLEEAVRRADERLASAVIESTEHIEAWVRSNADEWQVTQLQTVADTLSQWSAETVAEIEALFASCRAIVKADTAALLGQALVEFEGRQPRGDGSDS